MPIKTEIEWFSPSEKLPGKGKLLLFSPLNDLTRIGYFKQDGYTFFECTFTRHEVYQENVKYWAYLPDLSEFE